MPDPDLGSSHLRWERRGSAAWVIIERPERRNALDAEHVLRHPARGRPRQLSRRRCTRSCSPEPATCSRRAASWAGSTTTATSTTARCSAPACAVRRDPRVAQAGDRVGQRAVHGRRAVDHDAVRHRDRERPRHVRRARARARRRRRVPRRDPARARRHRGRPRHAVHQPPAQRAGGVQFGLVAGSVRTTQLEADDRRRGARHPARPRRRRASR